MTEGKSSAAMDELRRVFGAWLILMGSVPFGQVIVRCVPEECVSYVTFRMKLLCGGAIELTEKVSGYHRGVCGKGIGKILTANAETLARKCAMVFPEYADEEELSKHWGYYVERLGYKVEQVI